MNEENIEVGSVVRLNSDDFKMTVLRIEKEGSYMCIWRDGDGAIQAHKFERGTIRRSGR